VPTQKYYAVKNGRKKGIFTSWIDCKESVDAYPGAVYKSFPSIEQAKEYLQDLPIRSEEDYFSESDYSTVVAYTDGSYSNELKRFSYAAVLFANGEKTTHSAVEHNNEATGLHNVAGELKAAMYAMQFTKKMGKSKLKLYYDYIGVEMWATGHWKAKNHYTQAYVDYVKKISKDIHIAYVKVKSHTGNKYNEEADKLARLALLQSNETQNDNSTSLRREILTKLSNNKSIMHVLSKNGALVIFDVHRIHKMATERWKADKKRIKDIVKIQLYYDSNEDIFVVGVFAEENESIYTFGSGEYNG